MAVIKLKDVTKIYGQGDGKTEALKGVNLEVDQGEMIAIMGPSGSGKSTILNIIGCIDKPTTGEYFLNDKNICDLSRKELASIRNKKIGFIFQSFNLLNEYNLIDNVTLPLIYDKGFSGSMRKTGAAILEQMGLKQHMKKTPNELSGGQQQRVAIARALITEPDIILADEPTGALDAKTGVEVMNIIKHINSQGKTVVVITHDPKVADYCSRIVRIEDRIVHML